MADSENVMPEPGEGTVEDAIVDTAACIEELSEALADTIVFKFRAHGAHWNVKGPAFGVYHSLFSDIYEDADGAIDSLAENLLRLDTDAPSTLDEFAQRSTIKPVPVANDDPQTLARDLLDMNDAVLESLEDAYECASELDEAAGLANLLADRIDMHRKWRWQLSRSISNPAEPKVEAPMNPDEATEVEEDSEGMVESPRSFVGEVELRNQPSLVQELRDGAEVTEQRHAPSTMEVRAQEDGSWTLTGLAAVFDSPSQDLGGFTEVIKRGAFKDVLADPNLDTRALFNHSQDMPLGRVSNGSLVLEETPRGLQYTVIVPKGLSYGDDLRTLLENGIVNQSSFAFRMPPKGAGQSWEDREDGTLLRTITKFGSLIDVSPVTTPAYTAATAGVADSSSSRSEEQGTPASGAEQGEQASDVARRQEAERALRERQLRLKERQLQKKR